GAHAGPFSSWMAAGRTNATGRSHRYRAVHPRWVGHLAQGRRSPIQCLANSSSVEQSRQGSIAGQRIGSPLVERKCTTKTQSTQRRSGMTNLWTLFFLLSLCVLCLGGDILTP